MSVVSTVLLSAAITPSLAGLEDSGLNQAFVLGTGRPPIPLKIIGQKILNCKFTEMCDLLPDNLQPIAVDPPLFTIEGGALIPSSAHAWRKK